MMTWQMRIYDSTHFWNREYQAMELIKEVTEEPDLGSLFEINDKFYRGCAKSPKSKVFGIEEITFAEEIEEKEETDFTCPYCLYEDVDAFELSNEGTGECSNCGSEIEYERVVEVSYRVSPIKRNMPIKI